MSTSFQQLANFIWSVADLLRGPYPIKSLVAFSGTVEDDKVPEKTYTEVEMNGGLKEKELPDSFPSG